MRPGMGRGLAGGCVVGAVWVTGMVVAGLGKRSKNFVIGFLMQLYVGMDAERGAWLARRPRPSGTGYKPGADTHYPARGAVISPFARKAETNLRIPARFGRKGKGGLGRVPRGAGARTCLTDLNSSIVSLW